MLRRYDYRKLNCEEVERSGRGLIWGTDTPRLTQELRPGKAGEVEFWGSRDWVLMWSNVCVHTKKSCWNPDSKTLETDRLQHDSLAASPVFFRQIRPIVLSFRQIEIRRAFQKCYYFNFWRFQNRVNPTITLLLNRLSRRVPVFILELSWRHTVKPRTPQSGCTFPVPRFEARTLQIRSHPLEPKIR